MKSKLFFTVLSIAVVFAACSKDDIIPSIETSSLSYSISQIDKIDISDAFDVNIEYSTGSESLEIETNDNLHDYIVVEQSNGSLSIRFDDKVDVTGNMTLKAHLKLNSVNEIRATGAVNISSDNLLSSENLSIELTGASKYSGSINSTHMDIHLTGASELDLSGTTESIDIDATGASHLRDFNLVTDDLTADLTGASSVSLAVNQSLNVSASGASTVYYKGDAQIESQNLSGNSQIVKIN